MKKWWDDLQDKNEAYEKNREHPDEHKKDEGFHCEKDCDDCPRREKRGQNCDSCPERDRCRHRDKDGHHGHDDHHDHGHDDHHHDHHHHDHGNELNAEQLVALASAVAVSLSMGKTNRELETLVNFLGTTTRAVSAILTQRNINQRKNVQTII